MIVDVLAVVEFVPHPMNEQMVCPPKIREQRQPDFYGSRDVLKVQ